MKPLTQETTWSLILHKCELKNCRIVHKLKSHFMQDHQKLHSSICMRKMTVSMIHSFVQAIKNIRYSSLRHSQFAPISNTKSFEII